MHIVLDPAPMRNLLRHHVLFCWHNNPSFENTQIAQMAVVVDWGARAVLIRAARWSSNEVGLSFHLHLQPV